MQCNFPQPIWNHLYWGKCLVTIKERGLNWVYVATFAIFFWERGWGRGEGKICFQVVFKGVGRGLKRMKREHITVVLYNHSSQIMFLASDTIRCWQPHKYKANYWSHSPCHCKSCLGNSRFNVFVFLADVDECLNNPCQHICTNTFGSYTCQCNSCYTKVGTRCDLRQCKISGNCYSYGAVNPSNQCQVRCHVSVPCSFVSSVYSPHSSEKFHILHVGRICIP